MNPIRISHLLAAAVLLVGTTDVWAKTLVFPHVLEISGSTTAGQLGDTALVPRGVNLLKGPAPKTPVSVDTIIEFLYVGGLPGAPVGGGGVASATVDLYLYDKATGGLMKRSDGQNACGPCTVTLSDTKRKESYRLDDLITQGAPPDGSVITGYVVATVSNDDANLYATVSVTANAGKGFELSVFGFQPEEVRATAAP